VAIAGGGKYTFRAFTLSAATYWVHVTATLLTLARRRGRFAVTPKTSAGERQPLAAWPTLVTVALLLGVMAYGLSKSRDASMFNNVAFAGVHACILLVGISAAFHRPAARDRFEFQE
jgi:cellulose synthase (UDP-forming)